MSDRNMECYKVYAPAEWCWTVGDGAVVSITEHAPRGEGDRWFYEIVFTDGETGKCFNVSKAFFRPTRAALDPGAPLTDLKGDACYVRSPS